MSTAQDSSREETVKGGVRVLVLLGSLFFASGALAAPDEAALGKAEGYPICPASLRVERRCLVGHVSRFDEVFPARKVAKGVEARPLKRAAVEPAMRYTYPSSGGGALGWQPDGTERIETELTGSPLHEVRYRFPLAV